MRSTVDLPAPLGPRHGPPTPPAPTTTNRYTVDTPSRAVRPRARPRSPWRRTTAGRRAAMGRTESLAPTHTRAATGSGHRSGQAGTILRRRAAHHRKRRLEGGTGVSAARAAVIAMRPIAVPSVHFRPHRAAHRSGYRLIAPLCIHSHRPRRNGWKSVCCTGVPVRAVPPAGSASRSKRAIGTSAHAPFPGEALAPPALPQPRGPDPEAGSPGVGELARAYDLYIRRRCKPLDGRPRC